MFSIPEHYSDAAKVQLMAQYSVAVDIARQGMDSMHKLAELNTVAARASTQESIAAAQQLLQAKEKREFFSLVMAQAQPTAEKALAYGQHLANIAAGGQGEFARILQEQAFAAGRWMSALFEQWSKAAPAGMQNMHALAQSLTGENHAGDGKVAETIRQAADAAQLNTAAMADLANEQLREQIRVAARATKH